MSDVVDYEYGWKKVGRELAKHDPEGRGRCVFEIDLDRSLVDGRTPDEVFEVLRTKAVDTMMRCYLAAQHVSPSAGRSRGFEFGCRISEKGLDCGGGCRS